jgi:hypothetical protein
MRLFAIVRRKIVTWSPSKIGHLGLIYLRVLGHVKQFVTNLTNRYFGSVAEFKYFVRTRTNQNSVHEEVKGRLNAVNDFCHSVLNLQPFIKNYEV